MVLTSHTIFVINYYYLRLSSRFSRVSWLPSFAMCVFLCVCVAFSLFLYFELFNSSPQSFEFAINSKFIDDSEILMIMWLMVLVASVILTWLLNFHFLFFFLKLFYYVANRSGVLNVKLDRLPHLALGIHTIFSHSCYFWTTNSDKLHSRISFFSGHHA